MFQRLTNRIWHGLPPKCTLAITARYFYGCDTVDYRLAAPEQAGIKTNGSFRLSVAAHYGGNIRHGLEQARNDGLQFSLTSKTQDYERLDLPSNYIQGFVKAIENSGSKQVQLAFEVYPSKRVEVGIRK